MLVWRSAVSCHGRGATASCGGWDRLRCREMAYPVYLVSNCLGRLRARFLRAGARLRRYPFASV